MSKRMVFIAVIAVMFVCAVQGWARSWKMPNGDIYKDPQVLGHTPLGLDIGFDGGVVFWKFSDLPEWLQKKYHYSPGEAEEYKKHLHAEKKELMERKVARTAHDEKLGVEEFAGQVTAYGRKIQNVERRIKHYKERMSELNKEYDQDQGRVTSLAEKPVSSGRGDIRSNGWGIWENMGGNQASDRDALVKDKVTQRFENQADDDRFHVSGLRTGLYQLERELPVMKDTYKHMQARLAKMRAELKAHPDMAAKTVKTRAVRIQDYENDLTKLTELFRKGVITKKEYDAKRGEIINEM